MGYLFRLPSNNEGTIVQYRPSFRISTILPPSEKNIRFIGGRGMPEISSKLDVPKLLWTQSFPDEFWGLSAGDFRVSLSFQVHEMEDDLSQVSARAYRLGNVPNDGTICWGVNPENKPYDLREATRIFWDAPFNTDLVAEVIAESEVFEEGDIRKLHNNLLGIIRRGEELWEKLKTVYPFLPPDMGADFRMLKELIGGWVVPPGIPKNPANINQHSLNMHQELFPDLIPVPPSLKGASQDAIFNLAGEAICQLALGYLYDDLFASGYSNALTIGVTARDLPAVRHWIEALGVRLSRLSGRGVNLRNGSTQALEDYLKEDVRTQERLTTLRSELKHSVCSCLDCVERKVQLTLEINELTCKPKAKIEKRIADAYSATITEIGLMAQENRRQAIALGAEFGNRRYQRHISSYKPTAKFRDQTKFFVGAANIAVPAQVDAVFFSFDPVEYDKVPVELRKQNGHYTFAVGFARYLGGTRYLVDFGGFGLEWCTTQRKLFSMRQKVVSKDAVPTP